MTAKAELTNQEPDTNTLKPGKGINIELNANLDLRDLAEASVRQAKNALRKRKTEIEGTLSGLRGNHTKLESKLQEMGEKAATTVAVTPLAKRLAKDLSEFAGCTYEAEMGNGSINISKMEIIVSMQIWDEVKKRRSSYATPAHQKEHKIKFTTEMKKVVAQLKTLSKEISDAEDDKNSILREMAEIPEKVQEAKDNLVLGLVGDQISDGISLLGVMGAEPPKITSKRRK